MFAHFLFSVFLYATVDNGLIAKGIFEPFMKGPVSEAYMQESNFAVYDHVIRGGASS